MHKVGVLAVAFVAMYALSTFCLASTAGGNAGNVRKVLVLYVGGTIGMQKNSKGAYVPVPNALVETIKRNPTMHNATLATIMNLKKNQLVLPEANKYTVIYEIKEYTPLLDSSNMSINDWIKIAIDLKRYYANYDGFVVLHGTDTMAYTSSALSFILENLQKPVIVTGAQIPLFELLSDARDNLVESIFFAGCFSNIHEVGLYFDHKLFRGNRATKSSTYDLDAFESPNFPALADAETSIPRVIERNLLKENCTSCNNRLVISTNLNKNVGTFSLFPTFTASQLKCILSKPLKGLVLHTYGAGNIPSNRKDIVNILREATKRGILIVNISLCRRGPVSDAYETGKILEEIGVISGSDMTTEAALAKMIYVLGKPISYAAKVQMLKANLRGELTSNITNSYH